MQSVEQTTVKRCQYCGNEFKAWKPSLRLCSELCEQNEAFTRNLSIINSLARIRKQLANVIVKPVIDTPEMPPATIQEVSEPVPANKPPRGLRFFCNALKAKVKQTRPAQAIKPSIAAPEIRTTELVCIIEQQPQNKAVCRGIRYLCNASKARVKQRIYSQVKAIF